MLSNTHSHLDNKSSEIQAFPLPLVACASEISLRDSRSEQREPSDEARGFLGRVSSVHMATGQAIFPNMVFPPLNQGSSLLLNNKILRRPHPVLCLSVHCPRTVWPGSLDSSLVLPLLLTESGAEPSQLPNLSCVSTFHPVSKVQMTLSKCEEEREVLGYPIVCYEKHSGTFLVCTFATALGVCSVPLGNPGLLVEEEVEKVLCMVVVVQGSRVGDRWQDCFLHGISCTGKWKVEQDPPPIEMNVPGPKRFFYFRIFFFMDFHFISCLQLTREDFPDCPVI